MYDCIWTNFSFGYIFDDDLIEFLEKAKKIIRIFDKNKKKTLNLYKKYNKQNIEHPKSGMLFVKENISNGERFISNQQIIRTKEEYEKIFNYTNFDIIESKT